jgi:2-C-methyl-D-erythritol 4-phosphate cytidylyltransferase / 2-C-methyl-D-erythritol 2,4-cyclodiphosphate synthase
MTGTAALIVAAGRGERAQTGDGVPKQYRRLAGGPAVVGWASEAFRLHPRIDLLCLVERFEGRPCPVPRMLFVQGGETRQESVRNGLEALAAHAPRGVLIHDGARPFVSAALIDRVIAALNRADAVAPMLPVTDTLRRRMGGALTLVARDDLLRAQTPQGFRFDAILDAHRRFAHDPVTDDFALAERAGLSLATVMGDEMNMKITTAEDFVLAERIASGILPDLRTAMGFDAHRFGPGDHVWLCGVKVPHTHGLEGHSDADVGLHALTDAILGAIGEGDIGMHFPSSDKKWAGVASHVFLERAADLLRDRRGVVANADVTLICEAPKIGPHRQAMRELIARTLGIEIDRVSVKATTTDGLGFTGRSEGIAAQATVTVRLPA